MIKYYLAYDDGNIVIRDRPNAILERYDKTKKRWIPDVELSRIYFGDMPVRPISEEEVQKYMGVS